MLPSPVVCVLGGPSVLEQLHFRGRLCFLLGDNRMAQFAIALLAAMTLTLAFFVWRFFQQVRSLRKRYAGITDLEAEITGARDRLRQTKREQQDFDSENEQRRAKLSGEYEFALSVYKGLKNEISLLEENLEDISFGLYKPHFSFQTSEEYKVSLESLRN